METQTWKHLQYNRNDAFLLIRGMPRLHAWSSGCGDPLLEIIQGNGQSLQWRASEWQCVSWEPLWHTNWAYTRNDFLILTTVNQMRMHSMTLYNHPHYLCISMKTETLRFAFPVLFFLYFCLFVLSSLVYLLFMHINVPFEIKTTLVICKSQPAFGFQFIIY